METRQGIPREMLYEIASLLNQPLLQLQEEPPKNPPAQPCETEFKTKGRFRGTVGEPLDVRQAITAILSAFVDALAKAKRFCELLSEDGCKKVKFVRYDYFDSDVRKEGDKLVADVELIVVWNCIK